jgi:glycosyltransferase involved in cell wall biosynthesis
VRPEPEPSGHGLRTLDLSSLPSPVRAHYIGSDLVVLPFADGIFDRAVIGDQLVAESDRKRLLSEVGRVVRRGGEIHIRLDTSSSVPDAERQRILSDVVREFALLSFIDEQPGLTVRARNRGASLDGEIIDDLMNEAYRLAIDSAGLKSQLRLARAAHEDSETLLSDERSARAAAERCLEETRTDAVRKEQDLRSTLARQEMELKRALWRTRVAESRRANRIAGQLRRLRRPWLLPSVVINSARIALKPATRSSGQRTKAKVPPLMPKADARTASAPHFPPAVFPAVEPRREMRVATILDEFSELAFRYEFRVMPVPRLQWRDMIDAERPAFLLVESAWNANGGEWKYAFTGEVVPKPDVLELIEYCRSKKIPTVYWNKEDPLEYGLFIRTARHFDWVFTVDENSVERYRRDLGHERVGVLPFGVQPRIHNPIGAFAPRTGDVAFAGTYYSGKYPERQRQMDDLLRPAIDLGLDIFSRFEADPKYRFPEGLAERVVGSLDYARMLTAYRRYKVFLNVNSVVDSRTMFSRRVLELLACGTPVVSGPSPGMAAMLGPGVVAECSDAETSRLQVRALLASQELRDRQAVLGLRAVMAGNTYSDRVDGLAAALGLPAAMRRRRVSIVAPTNRSGSFRRLLATVAAQTYDDVELVIGLHGIDDDDEGILSEARLSGLSNIKTVRQPADWSLGRVLNELVIAADGDFIAKMDDDDFYGPNYLADQMRAFDYCEADVVGKWSRFILMEDVPCLGVIFPGKEHCYTELVGGGTLLARREVFKTIRFADRGVGEDTQFLRDCAQQGLRTYSTDRFNYVYRRTGLETAHTYRPHRLQHLANTRVISFGTSVSHAFL